jgi:nucleoside-diphosphate-sugar epimerase
MSIAVYGSTNVLEMAIKRQTKSVVYLSSMEVYGQVEKEEVSESDLGYLDLTDPRSSYPESKRFCECLCDNYCQQYGVPVKIARLAMTFGAGAPTDDTRVFAQFGRSVLEDEDIVLHTAGNTMGNYCYTADTIRAILLILLNGKNGEAYNVSNPNACMTIRAMADLVAGEIGQDRIGVRSDVSGDGRQLGYAPLKTFKLNIRKLRKLGWEPQYDMAEMYRRMVADWEAVKYIT